jgi:hypothetical protein
MRPTSTGSTMTTGLDLTHYGDVASFLDKPQRYDGVHALLRHAHHVRPGEARGGTGRGLKTTAGQVEHNGKGTYTYLVLRSLDTEDVVRMFEQYVSKGDDGGALEGKGAVVVVLGGARRSLRSMEGLLRENWGVVSKGESFVGSGRTRDGMQIIGLDLVKEKLLIQHLALP